MSAKSLGIWFLHVLSSIYSYSSFWSLHLLAFWFIFVSRPEGQAREVPARSYQRSLTISSSAFWLSSRLYAGQKATACKLGIACLFFLEFTRNSSSAFWLSSRLYAGQKATACKLASVMQNQVTDNFLNSSFWSLHLLAFWFIFVSRPEGYSLYSQDLEVKREDSCI